jgi:hypothetical protein
MVPLADKARLRNATRVRRHRGLVSVEGYRLSVEARFKLSGRLTVLPGAPSTGRIVSITMDRHARRVSWLL